MENKFNFDFLWQIPRAQDLWIIVKTVIFSIVRSLSEKSPDRGVNSFWSRREPKSSEMTVGRS
jgi:hypothetical protein